MSEPRVVLQKLLPSGLGGAIVERGYDQVGGIVVEAGSATSLRTPEALLAAYGFDQAASARPEFIDVVRFETPRLAETRLPPEAERAWPTYPTGFLRADAMVPVWDLSRTRYSFGAGYWRIRADGEQKCLSVYQGCARGWRGSTGWQQPSPLVGTRARWQGQEFAADVVEDRVLITLLGAERPAGEDFTEARPGVFVTAVPLADCELFEVQMTGLVNGVRVRLIAADASQARVLLLSDDEAQANAIGASSTEQGVFEATLLRSQITNLQGVTNELASGT